MTAKKFPRFESLDFGFLDAHEEAREAPDLLINGYFDYRDAAYRVAQGEAWALIGPKGAGKSAALEHLSLLWDSQPEKFMNIWDLGGFPVSDVTTIKVGSAPGPTSTRAAWEFLLLLKVFESVARDQLAGMTPDALGLRRDLITAGLIEGDDLRTRFADWSTSTMKFSVGPFGFEGGVSDSEVTALQVTQLVRRALGGVKPTASQHVLAIDGLDSFFAQSEMQLESLGSLVDAAYEVNGFLRGLNVRASIVLSVRNDMFVLLPSTDSAKLGDRAVYLDWSDGGVSKGNELWELVSKKAKSSVTSTHEGLVLGDVRKAYLASNNFGIRKYTDIPSYLLSNTRLLPRDLVALMQALQTLHRGSGQVRQETVVTAVRRYAENYFVSEVSNGLSRILPGASAQKVAVFLQALSALDNRKFRAADLKEEFAGSITDFELRVLLEQMFKLGALGVISKSGGGWHTNFIYRRTAGGGFSYLAQYVLHDALAEAWNLNR